MSCWVATTVAVDYLGLTQEELQCGIAAGLYPVSQQFGFQAIDVLAKSPKRDAVQTMNAQASLRLHTANDAKSDAIADAPVKTLLPALPHILDGADDVDSDTFTEWRAARARTALTRRAPRSSN